MQGTRLTKSLFFVDHLSVCYWKKKIEREFVSSGLSATVYTRMKQQQNEQEQQHPYKWLSIHRDFPSLLPPPTTLPAILNVRTECVRIIGKHTSITWLSNHWNLLKILWLSVQPPPADDVTFVVWQFPALKWLKYIQSSKMSSVRMKKITIRQFRLTK